MKKVTLMTMTAMMPAGHEDVADRRGGTHSTRPGAAVLAQRLDDLGLAGLELALPASLLLELLIFLSALA